VNVAKDVSESILRDATSSLPKPTITEQKEYCAEQKGFLGLA